jgi:hypothetical protein
MASRKNHDHERDADGSRVARHGNNQHEEKCADKLGNILLHTVLIYFLLLAVTKDSFFQEAKATVLLDLVETKALSYFLQSLMIQTLM